MKTKISVASSNTIHAIFTFLKLLKIFDYNMIKHNTRSVTTDFNKKSNNFVHFHSVQQKQVPDILWEKESKDYLKESWRLFNK